MIEKIDFKILTLSPVVLTATNHAGTLTESQDMIGGATLRGVFAEHYIHCQRMNRMRAQEQGDFYRFFFQQLRFVTAYPSLRGRAAIPLPSSLLKSKDGKKALDALCLTGDENTRRECTKGMKSWRGLGIINEASGEIVPITPKKMVSIHMSRNSEKERLMGRSDEQVGGIYNYESISAGQEFSGSIIGERENLDAFVNEMRLDENHGMVCLLGRSKFTQYGRCRVEFSVSIEEPLPKPDANQCIFLRLQTPLLPMKAFSVTGMEALGHITDVLRLETGATDIFLDKEKIYASTVSVDSFVGIWRMKRPRLSALAAGSIFSLCKKSPWKEEELRILQRIMYSGELSLRPEEGFGQLRQWIPQQVSVQSRDGGVTDTDITLHETVRKQALWLLNQWLREQVRMRAAKDAEIMERESSLTKTTGTFSKLENFLRTPEGKRRTLDEYRQVVRAEAYRGKPFTQHLKNIFLNKMPLGDIMERPNGMPDSVDHILACGKKFANELGENLMNRLLEELWQEYWSAFLTHGRKQASKQKGDGADE